MRTKLEKGYPVRKITRFTKAAYRNRGKIMFITGAAAGFVLVAITVPSTGRIEVLTLTTEQLQKVLNDPTAALKVAAQNGNMIAITQAS